MKKITLFFLAAFAGTVAMAQSSKEVNWTVSAKKISDKTYEIDMVANIGNGFHLYAQNVGGDGPIPTSFSFTTSPLIALNGAVKENGKMISKFESAWNHNVNYYENTVTFSQIVKLKTNVKTQAAFKVSFMVCNDHECLPPSDVDLKANIGG